MLTTKDNPYSPFDQFDLWLQYDLEMGYQTCERLGKIILLEDGMTDKEKEEAMDQAIDEIVKNDPLGIFVRATENSTYPIGA
jgi:hypothetical protein